MPKLNTQRTNGGLFLTAFKERERENSKDFLFSLGKQKKTKHKAKAKPKHKPIENPKQTNKSKTKQKAALRDSSVPFFTFQLASHS